MARKPKKEPRRKPGTGGIRYRPGRARPYEAAFPVEGGHRYDSFETRSDATAWLDALAAEQASADARDLAGGSQTFSTYIATWLDLKRPAVRPKTFHGYLYLCELAIGEGGLGPLRLDTIRRIEIDRMLAVFHAKQFGAIAQLYGVLHEAFEYALSNDFIKKNPLHKVKPPAVARKKIVVLTEAQRTRVLELAREEHRPDVPLLPLWHLYSRLGLRKGEGIALRWSSVNWERRTLLIEESVSNVGPDNLRGSTKTNRRRTVPLPDDIYDLLRMHQAAQQQRGVFASIFVDSQGETVTPQHVQYRWSVLRKLAGVEGVTLHGLRHTCLYLMALEGVPDSIRMAIAGHTTKDMAEHYTNHANIEDIRRYFA